jgi:hypothetical protein
MLLSYAKSLAAASTRAFPRFGEQHLHPLIRPMYPHVALLLAPSCFAFHPSQAVVSTLSPFSHLPRSLGSSSMPRPSIHHKNYSLSQQPDERLTHDNRLLVLVSLKGEIALVLHQFLECTIAQLDRRFPRLPVWASVYLRFEVRERQDGERGRHCFLFE